MTYNVTHLFCLIESILFFFRDLIFKIRICFCKLYRKQAEKHLKLTGQRFKIKGGRITCGRKRCLYRQSTDKGRKNSIIRSRTDYNNSRGNKYSQQQKTAIADGKNHSRSINNKSN